MLEVAVFEGQVGEAGGKQGEGSWMEEGEDEEGEREGEVR